MTKTERRRIYLSLTAIENSAKIMGVLMKHHRDSKATKEEIVFQLEHERIVKANKKEIMLIVNSLVSEK